MIPYKLIDNIMNKHFKNEMYHRPYDKILESVDKYKIKYRFPCEVEQTLIIDNIKIILHHYKRNYKDIILFFPGGSFIDPPTILHSMFAKKIARKCKKHVIMIQYPLFPEVNPLTTTKLIRKVISYLKLNNITLMGDSAGANLALFVLESLHKDNINIVNKAIIISPWINGKLENEYINIVEQYDFILQKDNCKKLANQIFFKYLKEKEFLCPSQNDFKFKNKILLFTGAHEILSIDAINWTISQNILNVKHYNFKNMCHCFIILPIKEAKTAIKKINTFLNK